jgi:hypothetical protein
MPSRERSPSSSTVPGPTRFQGPRAICTFGIFIHHNPLKPGVPVADINDPSQITDLDGFVGLTHIRGGGTRTNTVTGATTSLAYQAA